MKKGDIIICSKPEDFNFRTSQLVVGDKYEIVSGVVATELVDQLVFDVKNVETGKIHTWVKSDSFITLEVLREFKLREILE